MDPFGGGKTEDAAWGISLGWPDEGSSWVNSICSKSHCPMMYASIDNMLLFWQGWWSRGWISLGGALGVFGVGCCVLVAGQGYQRCW